MKSRGPSNWVYLNALIGGWLAVVATMQAQMVTNVVNDGTTATNLTRMANVNGTGGAIMDLTVDDGLGMLLAGQSADFADYPVRAAWYASGTSPAGGAYAVSARVRPIEIAPERRVGIMGWLDTSKGKGIAFQICPAGALNSFQVSTVNFKSAGVVDNETVTNLFNLDGTPATADYGSAWSPLGEYDGSIVALMELSFSVPTAADKAALSGVTAHLTAKVFQRASRFQMGDTIELLTNLPLPGSHRFGYFAVWRSINAPGGPIGYLDGLTVVGEEGKFAVPPVVEITSPANNMSFTAPADFYITAAASDPDGTIAKLEFYVDDIFIGLSTFSPATVFASEVPPGTHFLTARATDNSGATTVSEPIAVHGNPILLTGVTPLPSPRKVREIQFTITGMTGKSYYVLSTADFEGWNYVGAGTVDGEPITLKFPINTNLPMQIFSVQMQR